MTASPETILALGAGRMGRGIAVQFAYAGHPVLLLDAKPRDAASFEALAASARREIEGALSVLAEAGLFDARHLPAIAGRVRVVPAAEAAAAFAEADVIFEGVPEIVAVKHAALAEASRLARAEALIASTTSTILVDELSPAVSGPGRFLNAHWLNPAYVVPLVEVSPGARTAPEATRAMCALLERVGKVPVVCKASPGFIVPRIQTLAMNEAARMVEEGVASAADIDRAVKYGFGFRFGVLGILEFIDFGGGDILHHAAAYLARALRNDRYAAPAIIGRNMAEGRRGLRDGRGFLDYEGMDRTAYARGRIAALVSRLKAEGLAKPPALPENGEEAPASPATGKEQGR
ncbi:MAG: 3-hydroxybutyryl-CoA dehydrogenase [Acetobacteraceae bacterium]|nr:3-hydroxybutyryl-CoA dehydrogenase [Acetobacteraceae bacterium]